jgi:hypothetical protein
VIWLAGCMPCVLSSDPLVQQMEFRLRGTERSVPWRQPSDLASQRRVRETQACVRKSKRPDFRSKRFVPKTRRCVLETERCVAKQEHWLRRTQRCWSGTRRRDPETKRCDRQSKRCCNADCDRLDPLLQLCDALFDVCERGSQLSLPCSMCGAFHRADDFFTGKLQ